MYVFKMVLGGGSILSTGFSKKIEDNLYSV